LAKSIGIELGKMVGFYDLSEEDRRKVPFFELRDAMEKMKKTRGTISWDSVDDPIKILLHHSDCDGEISPKDSEKIVNRLEILVPQVFPDPDDYNRIQGEGLIQGLKESILTNKPIEFC
jgi:hypothetical protein